MKNHEFGGKSFKRETASVIFTGDRCEKVKLTEY